jgi:hypothetical protein
MPDSVAEVKWRPGERDNQFRSPDLAATPGDYLGTNGICVTWAGIPTSTGVRVRMVVVYETQPQPIIGTVISMTSNAGSTSSDSVNKVLTTLDKWGDWAYSMATGPAAKLAWDVGTTIFKKGVPYLALM